MFDKFGVKVLIFALVFGSVTDKVCPPRLVTMEVLSLLTVWESLKCDDELCVM